ncbi:MAG: MobF family relaxase [Pirellulales bacterium]
MLSIKVLKAGSEDYYLDLVDADYYLNGGEPPGKWVGSGCSFFGLSGTVERDAFKRIFNGFHPRAGSKPPDPPTATTKDNDSREKEVVWLPAVIPPTTLAENTDGTVVRLPDVMQAPTPIALVANAGRKKRRNAFDLTFSAPKSVSVLWSQATPEMRTKFEQLHDQAVADTLSFLERTLAYSRTGKAGRGEAVSVRLVAANFQHGTSRADDPQLHSHLLVMNVGVDDFDKTRSIESKPIFRNKMLLGAIYRSHLAHSLHRQFGLNAERKGDSFEILGVPDEVIQDKSKRRKQIELRLKEERKGGAIAAAHAALATRQKKKHRPRSELFAEWRNANEALGFTDKTLQALVCPTKRDYQKYIDEILKEAFQNIQHRLRHFTAHGFLREVLYVAPAYGVSPDALHQPVQDFLRDSQEVVPIITTDGFSRFASTKVLKQEIKMLNVLRQLHNREGSHVDDKTLDKVLVAHDHLNEEQQAAVKHITQSDKAIRIVQGYAGTGKTTMLRTAVQAWQTAGYNIVGACFTGAAADTLQDEIGVPCDTINMTLADFKEDAFDTLRRWGRHTAKQMIRAAQKKKTYRRKKPQRPSINNKTIVLLDEAGMINTRHMLMLMEWVQKHGATLVLTGDAAQLPAVEGGSPFLSLSKRVGYAEMTQIRRQKDEWARAAALHMARGEIAEALALYDKRGLVKVEDDMDDALEHLVKDWSDCVWDHPEDARILTLTNDQADAANRLAQEKLIERRVLDTSDKQVIEDVDENSGRAYGSYAYIGDRVLFTKNDRKVGVRNGQTGTILKFISLGRLRRPGLRVKLDNGKVVKVPLHFKHVRLGYASTVHKAQGATYSEVFVLLGGAAQNQPLSYVQGTRSRVATHFYTEKALYDQCQDIEDSLLVNQMEQDIELSLAVDLFVPTATAADREDLMAELLKNWKARAESGSHRSLVFTKDNADAQRINEECNKIRFAIAQIDWEKRQHGQRHTVATSAMPIFHHDGKTIVVGDRLRVLQSTHASGLIQNDLVTVTGIATDRIELKLDREDKCVSLAVDKLPPLGWGYAMKFEQAVKVPNILENAFLFQPDKFHQGEVQPEYCTQTDYFRWQPTPLQSTTVFASPVYSLTDYTLPSPPQNTWTYITPQQTQMNAAWHHQVYQANQTACWQAHQHQYPIQTTITHSHSHHWQYRI